MMMLYNDSMWCNAVSRDRYRYKYSSSAVIRDPSQWLMPLDRILLLPYYVINTVWLNEHNRIHSIRRRGVILLARSPMSTRRTWSKDNENNQTNKEKQQATSSSHSHHPSSSNRSSYLFVCHHHRDSVVNDIDNIIIEYVKQSIN